MIGLTKHEIADAINETWDANKDYYFDLLKTAVKDKDNDRDRMLALIMEATRMVAPHWIGLVIEKNNQRISEQLKPLLRPDRDK